MITHLTLVEDLKFPYSIRIKKAIRQYNLSVDKKERIVTVEDLITYDHFEENSLTDFLGVGPKTYQLFLDHLNEAGLW
jgi:endonuclease III